MSSIFKIIGFEKRKSCLDGDDDGDDGYDYAPAACIEGGGDDDDGDYDYAPAASLEGDDDDGDYDYAPAACIEGGGDDDDGDYDYAPAASLEGNATDDDGDYDYALQLFNSMEINLDIGRYRIGIACLDTASNSYMRKK